MYQYQRPESEIHKAFRSVPTDSRDEASDNQTPLHLACMHADLEAVRILMEREADPNLRDANGNTPIYILGRCRCTDEDAIREAAVLLLTHGAKIPRSGRESTALLEAVRSRHFGMIQAIIDSSARISSTDENGENILHLLAQISGRIEKESARAVREKNEALHLHFSKKDLDGIETKIKKLHEEGETAFRLTQQILESGKIDPDERSDSGETPWDVAISEGAMKTAALLSGSEPGADSQSALHGNMNLFQALYHKNRQAIEALIRPGAELQTICEDNNMYDFKGKSPLGCAFTWFDTFEEYIPKLLQAGADPNYRFPDETTAFTAWVSRCHSIKESDRYASVMELMKQNRWDIELPADKAGNAPLALSCRYAGYFGVTAAAWLLRNGAHPNSANLSGQTPLMILYGGHPALGSGKPYGCQISSNEALDILEILLEAGADPGRMDNYGNTFLHYAAASCYDSDAQATLELLADFKIPDIAIANNEGKTAMDVAADYNNENFIRLLLKYS